MPPTQRRHEPGVIARLFAQPQRFTFFQAVRLLELWLKRRGVPRRQALANVLRFQNSLALSFPPSQLEAIVTEPADIGRDADALDAALDDPSRADAPACIRITPAFMGFLGTTGTLPAHYTERIAAHVQAEKDEGPRAFLDVFSHRTLSLFYEAWRKYRLELHYELDGHDDFLPLLLSFAGLGHGALRDRLSIDGVRDESVAHFAAAMRLRPPSAAMIGAVLSDYFHQPVVLTQFVGAWYDVPAQQQSSLDGRTAQLGTSALVGQRVWQRDLRLRLRVGPLDRAAFNSFLPGGGAARALAHLLALITGLCLEYEVQLVLRAADVGGASLRSERADGRLGWDCFLGAAADPAGVDRADLQYALGTV